MKRHNLGLLLATSAAALAGGCGGGNGGGAAIPTSAPTPTAVPVTTATPKATATPTPTKIVLTDSEKTDINKAAQNIAILLGDVKEQTRLYFQIDSNIQGREPESILVIQSDEIPKNTVSLAIIFNSDRSNPLAASYATDLVINVPMNNISVAPIKKLLLDAYTENLQNLGTYLGQAQTPQSSSRKDSAFIVASYASPAHQKRIEAELLSGVATLGTKDPTTGDVITSIEIENAANVGLRSLNKPRVMPSAEINKFLQFAPR